MARPCLATDGFSTTAMFQHVVRHWRPCFLSCDLQCKIVFTDAICVWSSHQICFTDIEWYSNWTFFGFSIMHAELKDIRLFLNQLVQTCGSFFLASVSLICLLSTSLCIVVVGLLLLFIRQRIWCIQISELIFMKCKRLIILHCIACNVFGELMDVFETSTW